MKAVFSLLALSSIFAGAFAAPAFPTQGMASSGADAVSDKLPLPIPAEVLSHLPAGAPEVVPEMPVKRDVSPEEFMSKFEGLMATVKSHTTVINATMKSFKEDQDKTVVAGLIKSELVAIFTAVIEVKESLAVVKTVMAFTVEEVHAIALILFAIIFEIAATVAVVLKVLGIHVLLVGILAKLAIVLGGLVLVVEGIVAGVLIIVNTLISVDGILVTVNSVFVGLPLALAKGKMVGM